MAGRGQGSFFRQWFVLAGFVWRLSVVDGRGTPKKTETQAIGIGAKDAHADILCVRLGGTVGHGTTVLF